MGNCWSGFAAT
jgi:hypothetical protein